jgi:hypothetical protein
MDLEDIERVRSDLKFRGAQGTTGVSIPVVQIIRTTNLQLGI